MDKRERLEMFRSVCGKEVVRHRLSTEAMMMVLMGLAWSCLSESRLESSSSSKSSEQLCT